MAPDDLKIKRSHIFYAKPPKGTVPFVGFAFSKKLKNAVFMRLLACKTTKRNRPLWWF